jgi:hypothetical protein
MATDNLTDAIKARGLTAVNDVTKIYDINPTLGGPIKEDKLWFFSRTEMGFRRTLRRVFFESDPTKQGPNPNQFWSANTRLTCRRRDGTSSRLSR